MSWLSWSLAYPTLCWFAFCSWGSWRLCRSPRSVKNTLRYNDPPARFADGTLLLCGTVLALPIVILQGTWLGFRTPFSLAQWQAMTTPGLPSYHPDVAAVLLFELAFQIAAFTYSFAVIASCVQKRRSFPWHFAVLVMSVVACTLFDQIIVADMIQVHRAEGVIAAFRTTVLAVFWVTYINRSNRVAKTFTSGPRNREAQAT